MAEFLSIKHFIKLNEDGEEDEIYKVGGGEEKPAEDSAEEAPAEEAPSDDAEPDESAEPAEDDGGEDLAGPEEEAGDTSEEPPSSMVRAEKALKALKKAAAAFIEKYGAGVTDEKVAADIQKRLTELTFRKEGDEQQVIKSSLKTDSGLSSDLTAISALKLNESLESLNETGVLLPEKTGLPMAIWAEEAPSTTQHGNRIKFDPQNGTRYSNDYPAMVLSLNPFIPKEHLSKKIRNSSKDLNILKSFLAQAEKYRLKLVQEGLKKSHENLTKQDYLEFIDKKKKGSI